MGAHSHRGAVSAVFVRLMTGMACPASLIAVSVVVAAAIGALLRAPKTPPTAD